MKCMVGDTVVEVVSSYWVMTQLFGQDSLQWPSYEDSAAPFMAWCEEHDASYYARPHENFFLDEAVDLALEEGKTLVVAEDLS